MDVLVLYSFVLYLPEDGDLSLKHIGDFIYTDDMWFCIKCGRFLVYEGHPEFVLARQRENRLRYPPFISIYWVAYIGAYYLRPAVTFQITAVSQLRPGLFRVTVLVASRGHFSGRYPCHSGLPKFRFQKRFADKMERWCCTNTKCICYIKCNDRPKLFVGGDMMHNHNANSEACINRQMLNNYVKRKAMEDLRERPRKLIHKELLWYCHL